jgi:tetratricopeptide (TPR) repeat protein
VGLVALLTAALLAADLSDEEVAALAEAAFNEGVHLRDASDQARPHFQEAAALFEELRRRGADNPALSLDLGNAYLLAEDLPRALLAYHRGLRLDPDNLALRDGRDAARARVHYPANSTLGRPLPESRPPWLPHLRPSWLIAGSAVCYFVGCAFLTRWLMKRNSRLIAFSLASLALASGLAFLVGRAADHAFYEASHPLVVIAVDDVSLRKGNGKNFPPRYETPLSRGVEAHVLFERGDWLQIELAGGEVGWVPCQAVVREGAGM